MERRRKKEEPSANDIMDGEENEAGCLLPEISN